MKFITLIFLIIGFHFSLFAQKEYQKALDESCSCVEKINLEDTDAQEQVQDCLEKTMIKNFEHLAEHFKVNMNEIDEQKGYEIGLKFGEDLLKNCEAFIAFSMKVAKESGDLDYDKIKANQDKLFYRGRIYKTEKNCFLTVSFLTSGGEQINFIVLNDFPNADIVLNFTEDNNNTPLTIFYKIETLYSTELNTFVQYKVITKIEH